MITDRIKYIAKLSAVGISSIALTYSLAIISTLITSWVSVYHIIFSPNTLAAGAHTGGELTFIMIVKDKPLAILIIAVIFILAYIAIVAGTKYAVAKITHKLVNEKGEKYLYPLLDTIIAKCRNIQPAPLKKGTDFALTKLKMMQTLRNESENKWVKRALLYALKKLTLSETDLNREGLDMYEIVKEKAINILHESTEPSFSTILTLLLAQWAGMFIIVFDIV